MHTRLRNRNGKIPLGRQVSLNVTLPCVILLAIFTFNVTSTHQTLGQSQPPAPGTSSLCNRDDSIEMIKLQVDVTRTFDNAIQRITVLIRAGDQLWPVEQEKARAVFKEAFDLAVQKEKDESANSTSTSQLMFTPDQRYVVIRAVAKRDPAWAKKLTEQVLKLDRQSGEQASAKDSFSDVITAQKLLDSARQLISTDINTAIDLARISLKYPATFEISRFLFALAEVNQRAADEFYDQALMAYADRPMREFLYLQAYPFGFREGGDMPVFGYYPVPANFVINSSLQRRFVQTLLRRAQQALETPLDEGDNFNGTSGTAHILQVLLRIEPKVRELLPDLTEGVVQAREKIMVSLPIESQKVFASPNRNEVSSSPEKTFDEVIKEIEKNRRVNVRDDLLATAVLDSSEKDNLESVVHAVDKISDSSIRNALLELVYFRRAKDAADGKRFDEAERLTSKVEGLEQRAFLHTEIARGMLRKNETQAEAREALEKAIIEANKAGKTIFAARTLLTASNLYAKIDQGRSFALLRDAIDFINRLDAPDFSIGNQTLMKRVKRRSNPGHFVLWFYMPGLDPETALREMGKIDFDGALAQSSAFTDKFQRAVTTLALADVCLRQIQQRPRRNSKKSPALD